MGWFFKRALAICRWFFIEDSEGEDVAGFFVRVILQMITWLIIFSLPAGNEGVNVFEKCQEIFFDNSFAVMIKDTVESVINTGNFTEKKK